VAERRNRPTTGQCLNSEYAWIEVKYHRCKTQGRYLWWRTLRADDDNPVRWSAVSVLRENIILFLHYRVAGVPALGIVRLWRLVF
jgi:hypothetical protein